MKSFLRAALWAFILLPGFLSAQINIAFHNGTSTIGGMTSRPDGSIVKTTTDTWNNPDKGTLGLNFSGFALIDKSGASTTATLTVSSGYAGFNSNGWGSSSQDAAMMEGWYGFKTTESLTVSNLPAAYASGFSVIIYGDSNSATRTMNYTIGGVTKTIQDNGTFSGTFTEGSHMASYSGLTGNSFTVTGNPNSGDSRSAINGIVIIPGTLPTPPEIVSFTTPDHYVEPGTTVALNWSVTGADTLSIDQGIGTVSGTTANATVAATTTYTLTATNGDGSRTATVRVGAGPPRPNIVFFLVDDMGPHDTSVPFNLNGSGNPVSYNFNSFYHTPNMETLAAQGMRFTTAYAQSVCSPTRTGLMTGRNSARHAVTDYVGSGTNGVPTNWRKTGLDATDLTLPQILQTAGYRTIHVGKAHFGSNSVGKDPLNLGFDVNIGGANFGQPGSYTGDYGVGGSRPVPHLEAYHNTGTYLTKALTLEANKAMQDAVDNGVPFYLNMSFYAVHAPFTHNPDATIDYSTRSPVNEDHQKFATMIEGMDIAVGEIRQKLIDLGVAKDTLVVFLGDNGSDSPATTVNGLPSGSYSDFPMRGKKGSKWEGGSRVPFIACWADPDASNSFQVLTPIPANSIETDIVASWDIPVTFLSAAGLTKPAGFGEDGHNLLPYFSGTSGSHRPQEVVIHYPHNHRSDFFSFIREGDMKLIYNYETDTHQLYNLAADPTETNDLISSDPETTTRLARKLAQRLDAMWGAPGPLKPTISSPAPAGNVISIPNSGTTDVDADGSVDTTEDPNRNGLIDAGETNPDDEDTDDDNTPDGDEAALGLDPLDQNSYFYLTPTTLVGGNLQITWPSAAGASFTIRSSTDLNDWTTIVTSGVSASAGTTTSYDLGAPTGPKTFYRVELE